MIDIYLQLTILLILICYSFASYKLNRELFKLSSLNAKQTRLVEFREIFKNLVTEFKKEQNIHFETVYLTDEDQEKKLIELLLIDLRNNEIEKTKQ